MHACFTLSVLYMKVAMCVRVCVCACVCETERVCVCVCGAKANTTGANTDGVRVQSRN